MEFKVIPNEQTPKIHARHEDIKDYIDNQREVLLAFLEFAKTRHSAVGLAANQVSICGDDSEDGVRFSIRAFALRDIQTREWSLVIDPIIGEYVGIKEMKLEGCLTWKGRNILAERSRGVVVKWYDMDGKGHVEGYKGFEAQIWQHETNHLNGVEENVVDIFDEPKPITVGRNDLCPCGSGKKYKKCCLLLL